MKLLSIEWLKIRNYRTFWILSALFVFSLIGLTYVSYQIKVNTTHGNAMATMIIGNPFEFPDVWQTVPYLCSYLLFLPGLLMVILLTNEFNFKTHRQNIIDGMSRFQFVISKCLIGKILALATTLIVLCIALVTGLFGAGSFSFDKIINLFYFYLQAVTYIFSGLVIGLFIKRSGLAIAVYLLYNAFIKNILTYLANKYLGNIGSYMPIKSADNLIPLPFLQPITKQFFKPLDFPVLLIMTIVYLIAFYFFMVKHFKSSDL